MNFLAEREIISNAQEGDIVFFGSYCPIDYVPHRKKNIEWIVIRRDERQIQLLSRYILAYRRYHEYSKVNVSISWLESDIRAWLNYDFLREAFSQEEQAVISISPIENLGPKESDNGNKICMDKVFLMSSQELIDLAPKALKDTPSSLRRVSLETYIDRDWASFIDSVNERGGLGSWWLRDTNLEHSEWGGGIFNFSIATYVYNKHLGIIDEGIGYLDEYKGIRPMINISLDQLNSFSDIEQSLKSLAEIVGSNLELENKAKDLLNSDNKERYIKECDALVNEIVQYRNQKINDYIDKVLGSNTTTESTFITPIDLYCVSEDTIDPLGKMVDQLLNRYINLLN